MTPHWDAIVIGGGAAGLSAAQTLGRSLRRTLVIDSGQPRNRFAAHMHNVLGLDGTPPLTLLERGRAEAAAYGVEFRADGVRTVREAGPDPDAPSGPEAGTGPDAGLIVELDSGAQLRTRALVVATGITDVLPDIPGLAERWGTSVLGCPYCHGWEVRGRRLAVVTVSPMGMHQATLIRQWSEDVTVFTAGLVDAAGDSLLDDETVRGLRARGVRLEPAAVAEVLGDGDQVTGVRTVDGRTFVADAIFTAGRMVPQDAFLADLELDRADTPAGAYLAVDAMGRTSHPRIWAAGNVVNPGATVPLSMGAGSFAGAALNATLISADTALAAANGTPAEFWERRYAGQERVWSGEPNRALAELAAEWPGGRALDLGCGEGGDVHWLADRGWEATGIDLAPTAIARARAVAADRGLDLARFVTADLGDWADDPQAVDGAPAPYDLVAASFFQSPVALPRERILRAAADRVAPGGRLVVIAHAPHEAHKAHGAHGGPAAAIHLSGAHERTPEADLAALGLSAQRWEIEHATVQDRAAGHVASDRPHRDSIVVARRIDV